jgi:hypothetical protein
MIFPLMPTIYQLAENVKQYAEIERVSSGGGANNMQRSKLEIKSVISGGGEKNMQRSKLGKKIVSSS